MQMATSYTQWKRLQNALPLLCLLVLLTVIGLVLLYTLGLRSTGLIEEWQWYPQFDNGIPPLFQVLVTPSSHPLINVARWIGYILTPNSFVGLNVLMIMLIIGQGLAVYVLINRLRPGKSWFALAAALLSVINPANNGLANNRYISYPLAILFFTLSVYFLVDFWQTRRRISFVAMFLCSFLNLAVVEVTYPIIILTPLLLVWLTPNHRIMRRTLRVAGFWYLAPIVLLLDTEWAVTQGLDNYPGYLLTVSTQTPFIQHVLDYILHIFHAGIWVLASAWQQAAQGIDLQSGRFVAAVFIAILTAICLWVVFRTSAQAVIPSQANSTKDRAREALRKAQDSDLIWLLIGLVLIGAGFAIYAYLPTHKDLTERVYSVSLLGGAIVLAEAASWLGRRIRHERLMVVLIISVLAGVALQSAMQDALRTSSESAKEQRILAQVVEQAPSPGQAKLILIFDSTHQFSTSILFGMLQFTGDLEAAFQYMYHRADINVRFCNTDYTAQSIETATELICTPESADVRFPNDPQLSPISFPLDKVIAFQYEGETNLKLLTSWPVSGAVNYNPASLSGANAQLPERAHTLFTNWPFQMQNPLNEHPVTSVTFDQSSLLQFLDRPTLPYINYGWYGNWTSSTRSTLDVWLSADQDYQIKTVISHSTLPETLKNITLTVNDQPIPLTAQTDASGVLTLTGTIRRAVVARDLTNTRITFLSSPVTSPLAAGTGTDGHYLGFQVDQLSVTPVATSS